MRLVIPGQPRAKQRPRHSSCPRCKCRLPPPYTPKDTKDEERRIASAARAQNCQAVTEELAMRSVFYRGDRRRVDTDNLQKLVSDALNTVAYADDYQLKHVWASREYDKENPRTEVEIVTMSEAKAMLGRSLERL